MILHLLVPYENRNASFFKMCEKMPTPLFFIMLSTFNRPDLVLRTVNSVIQQEYSNYNLMIFNDGSIESYSGLESIIKDNNKIIYKKSSINVGTNESKNYMIDYCLKNIGNDNIYFFVLDDDDYLIPNALSIIAEEIIENESENWLCFNCISLSQSVFKNTSYNHYDKKTYTEFKNNYPGDKHFVFKLNSIGNIRFPQKYFKNGYEHIFLDQLNDHIFITPKSVKVIEYQAGGLSLSPLYSTSGSIITATKHILSAPLVTHYYLKLIKSLTFKNILLSMISEEKYYKLKRRLGFKVRH